MATTTRLKIPQSAFVKAIRESGLVTGDDIVALFEKNQIDDIAAQDPLKLASMFVRARLLTKYQALQLLQGRTRGFMLGRYKILDAIGQDRVGMIFLGEDTVAKRRVSIKILPADRVSDDMILSAFIKEVRRAAQVEHPYTARVLDLAVQNNLHFVVSEHVTGSSLQEVITKNGPIPPNQAARIIAQVALVLWYAHRIDLLHRDIKPGNIVLTNNQHVKLLDLGLSHMLENPWIQVTKRIKTSEYAEEIDHVAPEQAWGSDLDGRSDIYSLGSTFYTILTGQSPFPGSAADKMTQRQLRSIPIPSTIVPGIPREIDMVVQKMGGKHPNERFQSAADVVRALQPWLPVAQWVSLGTEFMPEESQLQPDQAKSTGSSLGSMVKGWFKK